MFFLSLSSFINLEEKKTTTTTKKQQVNDFKRALAKKNDAELKLKNVKQYQLVYKKSKLLLMELCCFGNKLFTQKFDLICSYYCSGMSQGCVLCFVLCLFPLWPVVHFRYSERSGGGPNLPFSLEGLCAHHGQTLAAQLAGGSSPRAQGQGRGYVPSSYPGNLPLLPLPSLVGCAVAVSVSSFCEHFWHFEQSVVEVLQHEILCDKVNLSLIHVLNVVLNLERGRQHLSLLQLTKLKCCV